MQQQHFLQLLIIIIINYNKRSVQRVQLAQGREEEEEEKLEQHSKKCREIIKKVKNEITACRNLYSIKL